MHADDGLRRALASQLEASARGYGAGAAERLGELTNVSGVFSGWLDYYAQRVTELSVGVLLDEPRVVAQGFAWSNAGLFARDASPPEAELLVRALLESLQQDLTDEQSQIVSGLLTDIEADRAGPGAVGARLVNDGTDQTRALEFLERTLRGDWRGAIDELTSLQRQGVSVRDLYERVLLPAAVEMGTMWHLGEIGISEEHATTEAILNAMSVLWHNAERAAPNGHRVVVGSVTSDLHSIGVRATAWLLELSGCMTACLGSDLPAPDFVQAATDYEADSVVIGATLVTHLPRVVETIEALRKARPNARIIVGGPAFDIAPGLAEKVGADALARMPGQTPELVVA